MVNWHKTATGYEAHVGPLRLAVYKRGRWVTEVGWIGRPIGWFWQEWRDTEEEAKNAAIAKGIEWIREEQVRLAAALEELGDV